MRGSTQDLRLAVRGLANAPGFSVVAILTLALGIAATTAVFSVVNAVVLRPLPYRASERLVHLLAADAADRRAGTSYRSYELWRSGSRSLEAMAVHYRNTGWSRVTVDAGGEPATLQAGFTSAGLFPLLVIAPVLGRTFTDDEEARHEPVAVLSHGLWLGALDRKSVV